MTTNEGFLTFNLLTYDQETQDDVYNSINQVASANKYLIEGEEDVNKVIIMTKGGKAGKGNQTPEDLRHQHIERVLKEWGVNKGLWLTQMRIKQKIDKVQPFKYVPLADGARHGEAKHAEHQHE
jgi:hypothetical protein